MPPTVEPVSAAAPTPELVNPAAPVNPPTPASATATGAPPDQPEGSIKRSAVRGVGWTSFIQIYRVAVGVVTTWVLALLLDDATFGLVAGAAAIVGFLLMLRDLGTGAAIVQRRELSQSTLSSIFWTNSLLGIGGTVALALGAPLIAALLGHPELVPVTRALALTVLFAGVGVTHQCLMQRDLRFGLLAKIETVALTAGAAAGIACAVAGGGAWALVAQSITTMALTTILSLVLHRWRPAMVLRLSDIRSVARFSLNLTGFNALNYTIRNCDVVLILRVMGKSEAGHYYLAVKLLLFPISSINAVLSRVLFPLFARIQDDDERLRNAFLKVTAVIATIVLPGLIGFAVTADALVAAALPAKWLPVIPLAMALVVVAATQSLATSVGSIYLAKGRTDLLLAWGVVACIAMLAAYGVGIQWGAVGVARAYAIVSVLLFWPALELPLGLIDTPLRAFFVVVWRPALAAGAMGVVVWGAGLVMPPLHHPIVDLAIRVPLGVATYVALSLWINRELLTQLRDLVRSRGRQPMPTPPEGI